jgi:predicted enzyme related to lactoylglutathione lyase
MNARAVLTAASPVVWTEIPVRDLAAARAFYERVLGVAMEEVTMGGTPTAVLPYGEGGVSMNLQQGEPAADGKGPVIHFAVPDVPAAVERAWEAGGKVLSPVLDIPIGRMCYCADPDGNRFGVFTFAGT